MRLIIGVAVLAAALAAAHAEDVSVKVIVNGEPQDYSPSARLRDGTVYVPLRQGAESLGATCKWQAQTNTAQICSDRGCALIRKGDGIIVNGSLLLSLRKMGQAVGAKVSWDADEQAVKIQSSWAGSPVWTSRCGT